MLQNPNAALPSGKPYVTRFNADTLRRAVREKIEVGMWSTAAVLLEEHVDTLDMFRVIAWPFRGSPLQLALQEIVDAQENVQKRKNARSLVAQLVSYFAPRDFKVTSATIYVLLTQELASLFVKKEGTYDHEATDLERTALLKALTAYTPEANLGADGQELLYNAAKYRHKHLMHTLFDTGQIYCMPKEELYVFRMEQAEGGAWETINQKVDLCLDEHYALLQSMSALKKALVQNALTQDEHTSEAVTTASKDFVKCYRGYKDAALCILKEALKQGCRQVAFDFMNYNWPSNFIQEIHDGYWALLLEAMKEKLPNKLESFLQPGFGKDAEDKLVTTLPFPQFVQLFRIATNQYGICWIEDFLRRNEELQLVLSANFMTKQHRKMEEYREADWNCPPARSLEEVCKKNKIALPNFKPACTQEATGVEITSSTQRT